MHYIPREKENVGKIEQGGEYYAIVTGKKRKNRIFWRNVLFTDVSVASFYIDQEAFAYEFAEKKLEKTKSSLKVESDIPERYNIQMVADWEIEDRDNLNLFEIPRRITVCLSNYGLTSSMNLPMVAHDDNIERIFFSGRFGFLGHNENHELLGDHFKNNVSESDSQLFGIRMRPAIQAPLRKHLFSMCGDGLPGLWYVNMGERIEKHCNPMFTERL